MPTFYQTLAGVTHCKYLMHFVKINYKYIFNHYSLVLLCYILTSYIYYILSKNDFINKVQPGIRILIVNTTCIVIKIMRNTIKSLKIDDVLNFNV